MNKTDKNLLIDKLKTQQTIVLNSSNETDFRRAEVFALLTIATALLDTNESGLVDVAEITTVIADNKKARIKKEVAAKESRKPTFKERMFKILLEAGEAKLPKQLMLLDGVTTDPMYFATILCQQKKHFQLFPNTTNERGKWLYGLKEWDTPFSEKAVEIKVEPAKVEPAKVEKETPTTDAKRERLRKNEFGINKVRLNLRFKIIANDPKYCVTVGVGDEVKFTDVLGARVLGKIVGMNPAGKMSLKDSTHSFDTVTIEYNGTLYDRGLDKILKN